MAKFTLSDSATAVSAARMLLDGKQDSKRLRLHDVGADKKKLQLNSTDAKVVTATLQALFDGPKGIWSVDLRAASKGKAEIEAKLNGAAVAKVVVTVIEKLGLPAAAGEQGMLVRLFLAEIPDPGQSGYNAADGKKSMQWMRVVLANRLKNNPAQFMAPGAKSITDIVKAKGQFKGFESYPTLSSKQSARIGEIVRIANDDNDTRQEKYLQYLQNALDVAIGSLIADPCPTGLYGWRTFGSGSPGPRFEAYGSPLSGNQFYTLKK